MGTIFRLLLRLLGCRLFERPRLTPVSKTIDVIPSSKSIRWLWGGILHLIPVAFGLAALFVLRFNNVTYGRQEIFALSSAAAWAFIGPALIWYYERYTLPILYQNCAVSLVNATEKRAVRSEIYARTLGKTASKIIVACWMVMVLFTFARSPNLTRKFGLHGYSDPLCLFSFVG